MVLPARRKILPALLSAFALWLALPQTGAASEVSTPIEALDAGLLQAMKAGKAAPFQQRYDLLAPFVMRAVDLDYILQSAIGASWASVTPVEQAALKAAFQRYSVAAYVSNFDDFSGERFELQPGGDATSVQVRIVPGPGGGSTHTLTYVMRQTQTGWKAVDVRADGTISQVVAQQSEIRSLFARGGASGLMTRLQQKTTELSGGALR
jgi:phospholipid transport system substrate-binding protein